MKLKDNRIIQLRQDLHRLPELSGGEMGTAQRIIDFLTPFAPDEIKTGIGGHGLLAVYSFGPSGPVIAIRCELDALPIREKNEMSYRSAVEGVSHKCGHDGHMAIVAGLAPWLATRPFRAGKVILMFQPAEETGRGAHAMLEDPRMEAFSPDYIFALHNLPGYPMHEILWVKDQFSATVLSLAIYFQGMISHASEPEKGRNPSLAVSETCIAVSKLINPNPENEDFALITPVYTRIGSRDYGISAGEGEIHFTLRTWDQRRMDELLEEILQITSSLCRRYDLEFSTEQFDYFPASINRDHCNRLVVEAGKQLGLSATELDTPMRFGEDFGFFTRKFDGAMFGLGAGVHTPPLHNDSYDFPDELTGTGISMFKTIIGEILD